MYYSLASEDLFLNENIFKNKKNGIYIELGAVDGIIQSNTKFFEDTLDWTGILIEPNLEMYEKLKLNRPNNFLFNNLISNKKEELDFLSMESITPVAGIIETLPKEHYTKFYENDKYTKLKKQIVKIKPTTLTDIINKTNFTHIDLLSLDVEGHELEVLKSYDFKINIYVILIETLGVDKNNENECRKILINNNYKFFSKCAHNEIFILKNCIYDKN